jgi:flagellar biosynthesis protein FlhF
MRLKTYVVNNVTEAIPKIKKDLGEDALILNTKKIKTGGFLGFFQKEQLEVIAAAEPETEEKPKKASYRTLPAPKEQVLDSSESNSELMKELKSIKQFMMRSIEEDKLPEALRAVNLQFIKEEITPEIQTELFADLMAAMEEHPDYTEQQVRKLTRTKIIDLIHKRQTAPEDKNPEIICFIGPTGVGKTTSIAKIAADYMLREDKKVGLITSDTYRIAAVEQLRTYASILNIPIQVVESAADLSLAMDELKDCDIVLMDTAGRNYQQKQYIEDLEALLKDKDKIQINLVLSLTSKYEDMKKIIDNFQTITMDQLLLTKKDETSSSGAILNLIYHYSLPIPFIANGQNVPDDIITVTPELIADFVLGEDDNG